MPIQATIQSRCECQATLSASLNQQRHVLSGWATEPRRRRQESCPAHSIDAEKDVDVEVTDGRLLITGKRHEEKSSEENGVIIRETRSGAFRREFALPEHVTADNVDTILKATEPAK